MSIIDQYACWYFNQMVEVIFYCYLDICVYFFQHMEKPEPISLRNTYRCRKKEIGSHELA